MKLLVTAQAFGFGPGSKAGTIAAYLREVFPDAIIDFAGTHLAYDLAVSKSDLYDKLHEANTFEDLSHVMDLGYNSLVSVMEPKSVIVAHSKGIPSNAVDSLFGFWDWRTALENKSPTARITSFATQSLEESVREFNMLHPHHMQLAGHVLANKSFLQTYPNSEDRHDVEINSLGNVSVVGPIVDTRYQNSSVDEDVLLISFCGQTNPLVGEQKALDYCHFVLDILADGLQVFTTLRPQVRPVIIGNQRVMSCLQEQLSEYPIPDVSAQHLRHEQYLQFIDRSVAVMGPPSITTMLESFSYGKPFLYLPEQNDSHWPNYVRITNGTDEPIELKLRKKFPGFLFAPLFEQLEDIPEEGIERIYQTIDKLRNGSRPDIVNAAKDRYKSILSDLANQDNAQQLYRAQMNSMPFFRSYSENGARTIANNIARD